MPRDHAVIYVSIWDDDDFVSLESVQQQTYFALCSSPDLSWCGVNPLLPKRLARLAKDLTERKVRASLDALEAARFLVIDHDTAEIGVRTFVRHDRILRQPNVTKAMVKALDRVHSATIRDAIVAELRRELDENPDAKGWAAIQSCFPELFAELQEKASRNPSGNPLRKVG